MFKDCVERNVEVAYKLKAKDYLNYCGENINDTRMMESKFTCFNPKYRIVENVLLLPYSEPYHIPSSGFFEHWAYDKYLNPIMIANHYKPILKGYKDHDFLPSYPFKNFKSKKIAGNYYYMGMLNPHFGHFIQESITRFWLALEKPNLLNTKTKFVFHVLKNFNKEAFFNSNLTQFLTALGMTKNNIIFVQEPIVLESVIIPESGISISDGNCYLSEQSKKVWNYVNHSMTDINKKSVANITSGKVYLSRSKVKNPIQGRVLTNEAELECNLLKLGFNIVNPEDYDQNEMQAILNKTKVIAGAPGSGLQNSFFIPHTATTIAFTTKPIIAINPGLNHQIHTDLICGNKTNAIIAKHDVAQTKMSWSIDVSSAIKFIKKVV